MSKLDFKHRDATKNGIDIAKGRVDDLDKEVIKFALNYKGKKVVVDIGSGESRLSAILAILGWNVWMYDIENNDKYCATLERVVGEGKVHCIQKDIREIGHKDLPEDIVIVISQRTLHHIENIEAKNILQKIYSKMIPGGKMFISISGIDSKLALGYQCTESSVESRFCGVGDVGKSVYSIEGNVCLYKQQEVVDMIEEIGLTTDIIYKSTFGNIKTICSKY